MSGKITAVNFNQSVQIGNSVERNISQGAVLDGRPIRLDLDSDSRGMVVHWTTADNKPMANLVPWTSIGSVILDMAEVKPAAVKPYK